MSAWSGIGARFPIVCAPMGGVAGGALASAVSRAGAVGMIGMGSAASPEGLRRELALIDTAGAPFGVGFVGWGVERTPQLLEIALAAGPALVSVSFLEWGADGASKWGELVRASGARLVTQAATRDEALAAEAAGADLIVARGCEAGGHGDPQRGLAELLDEVLGAVSVPVLAAGAISDREDVERILARGAAGVWVGTAFSACDEALTSAAAREALIAAEGEQTVVSRVLDVALELPWPERFPERLVRTPFIERWDGREAELAKDREAKREFLEAYRRDDFSIVPLDAGMGVGRLKRVRPAEEVVAELAGVRVSE